MPILGWIHLFNEMFTNQEIWRSCPVQVENFKQINQRKDLKYLPMGKQRVTAQVVLMHRSRQQLVPISQSKLEKSANGLCSD